MTLSNIGPIKVEEEYEAEIERFHLMIGVSKRQPMKCAVCAYGEHVVVTFTSVFQDTRLQDRFFRLLKELGVSVETESNGVPDSRDDKAMYPAIQYDPKQWKEVVNTFYGILLRGRHTGSGQFRHILRIHVVSHRHRLYHLCGADITILHHAACESGIQSCDTDHCGGGASGDDRSCDGIYRLVSQFRHTEYPAVCRPCGGIF